MKNTVALLLLALLGLTVGAPKADSILRSECDCQPAQADYEFCATDYNTYSGICWYRCSHNGDFHHWHILYDGPCLRDATTTSTRPTPTPTPGPSTRRTPTTPKTTKGTYGPTSTYTTDDSDDALTTQEPDNTNNG